MPHMNGSYLRWYKLWVFYTATGFAPFLSAPFQTFKPPTNRLMEDWLELTAGGGGGAYGGGTAINEKIRQWW